jgi:hypothetical protein
MPFQAHPPNETNESNTMIEELKKALAADPGNPFLQGHVEALEGYCDNCPNPVECYQTEKCWPITDHDPNAGELCAEMDEAHVEYQMDHQNTESTTQPTP